MASQNKKDKTDKKKHPGRSGPFLKASPKLKGVSFYNSSDRQKNKKIDD